MKNLVIGGGFSGLYFAYKNSNSLVFSDKTPENQKIFSKNDDNFIFLRYDSLIKKMLNELGINFKLKKLTMSYFYNNEIHKKAEKNAVHNYYLKTYNISDTQKFMDYNNFKIFTTKYSEVIEKLEKKCVDQIIYERVKTIDEINKKINEQYNYENAINTLPLPILCNMLQNQNFKKQCEKLKYISVGIFEEQNIKNFKTDVILNMDPDSKVLRYIKTNEGYIAEKLITEEKPKIFLKYGRLTSNEDSKKIIEELKKMNIYNFGRFAQWKEHYETQDAIRDIETNNNILSDKND